MRNCENEIRNPKSEIRNPKSEIEKAAYPRGLFIPTVYCLLSTFSSLDLYLSLGGNPVGPQ